MNDEAHVEEAERIARYYVDAWNAHDPHAAAALFGAGARFSDPGHDGNAADIVPEVVRGSATAFPDMHFEVLSMTASGAGRVVLEWRMRGTHQGPGFGLEPSGRTIDLCGADVIEIRAGNIAALRSYFDMAGFAQQIAPA